MKTINVKNSQKDNIILDDQCPCYFADLIKANNKKDYKWRVGCRGGDKNCEFIFKLSSIINISNDNAWNEITGLNFALQLISEFKNGGEIAIKKIIKNYE